MAARQNIFSVSVYTPPRKIHLYHCDHQGLPVALVDVDGKIEWPAEYDALPRI
nr:RHS domain-containing protein [Serratia marcescens]